MPKGGDWFNFAYVTVAYIALALGMMLFLAIDDIRANWPKYRCNPMYMPLSKNVQEDFTFCVQNMQANYMGVLLKPITWIIKNLGTMAGDVFGSLQKFRKMISFIRDFITNIVGSIMGIFANITIQMQKLSISIKDSVGKMVGVMVTLLYTMDGSVKTMQSAWAGPPGQMVRAICFRDDTLVEMENGELLAMNRVSLGDKLSSGKSVYAVLKVANANKECFYRMSSKCEEKRDIFVTGSHYVLNEYTNAYCMVKDHPDAVLTSETAETFSCLITEDHTIPIGGVTFWDWEDDLITK
jgi:hypothetical protein